VAHSLTSGPTVSARILGAAGVVAGVVILLAYVVDLPAGLFPARVVAFCVGVIAIGIGVHRRQAAAARRVSLAVTGALVVANALYLAQVLFDRPFDLVMFWSGVALWLSSALFGFAAAWIGAVNRWAALAVALGSLLAITGIDRLGLVSESSPTIFNTLSQVGIVIMAVGWIVLGIDVATRRSAAAPVKGSRSTLE